MGRARRAEARRAAGPRRRGRGAEGGGAFDARRRAAQLVGERLDEGERAVHRQQGDDAEGLAQPLGALGAHAARRLGHQLLGKGVLHARVQLVQRPRRLEHLRGAQLAHGEPLLHLH